MTVQTIQPQLLAELYRAGRDIELIDVRTPAEFQELHVDFARNVPLDSLQVPDLTRFTGGTGPLYVVCQTGSRGRQACQRFSQAGFMNVVNVEGGTLACEEAGLPVIRGSKTISLERQVRIAAGLLVLSRIGLS